jgi:HPt (histidine-containing phosphotransfer) domain-containing protein
LPELDGFDVKGALVRVGGDRSLYRRILIRFHESQIDVIARLRQSLTDGDRETVQYIAHTLKGAAGNVGAAQISDMAAELEQTMVKGGDVGEIFMDQLEAALTVVLKSLGQWLPFKEDMGKQKSASERSEALPLMRKMREMLEDSDGDAVDLIDDLKIALQDSSFSKDVNRLQSMLDSYDFEAALEMLKRLQNELARGS